MRKIKKNVSYPIILYALLCNTVIVSNVTGQLKTPRPDAPANTANNAIVGPGSCDLSPVLQLLNLVKCNLVECCDELEQDFRETWTILADINETLTECCICNPIPITTSTTITITGVYCLANDISGPITIDSFDVVLDLNGHVILGGTNGIEILSDNENVIIKNGSIKHAVTNGILVNAGCKKVEILDLEIIDSGATKGINFFGTPANRIADCRVERTIFVRSGGLEFRNADSCIIQDCDYLEGNDAGFGVDILSAGVQTGFVFRNCRVLGPTGILGIGFAINNVDGLVIENCIVDGTSSGAFDVFSCSCVCIKNCKAQCLNNSIGSARGFNLLGTSTAVIENCITEGIESLAVTTGFQILGSGASSIVIKNCKAIGVTGNSAFGFSITSFNDCVLLRDCEVTDIVGTGGSSRGYFTSSSSTRITFDSCISCNVVGVPSGNGFELASSTNSCIFNCVANGASSDAFLLTSCTDCLVGESVGKNSLFGFRDTAGVGNVFFNNFAFNNGTNYSGIANTAALGVATTTGVNLFA